MLYETMSQKIKQANKQKTNRNPKPKHKNIYIDWPGLLVDKNAQEDLTPELMAEN